MEPQAMRGNEILPVGRGQAYSARADDCLLRDVRRVDGNGYADSVEHGDDSHHVLDP